MKKKHLALLCGALLLLRPAPSLAGLPAAFEAELDARMAENDIAGLLAALNQVTRPSDRERVIAWAKERASAGTGFDGLPLLLAKALRETGRPQEAEFWLTYGRALLLVDGLRCTYRLAVEDKLRHTLVSFKELDRAWLSQPQPARDDLIRSVIALEASTKDRRKPDPWLCVAMANEFPPKTDADRGLAASDPRYAHAFRDDAEWQRERDAVIRTLGPKLEAIQRAGAQAR